MADTDERPAITLSAPGGRAAAQFFAPQPWRAKLIRL
jgi:hypothetical protein